MASPAPKPPAGNPNDTAAILAAIRDLGDRMERRFANVETEQKEQRREIGKVQQDVVRIEGRLAGIEGQLRQIPTLYQLAGLIFAIFGAAFVLIRFASGH
jgi:hypothetical protein